MWNCRGNKKRILNLLICSFAVILLNVYMGNIAGIREQILCLPEVVKVDGLISNLNGTLTSGLKIKEEYVDGLLSSEYVADPVFSVQLKMGIGTIDEEDYQEKLGYHAVGTNSAGKIRGLSEENADVSDFFSSSERVCILDSDLAREQGIKTGDTVCFTTAYYRYGEDGNEIFLEPLEIGDYTVIGIADLEDHKETGDKPDVIVPFETVRSVFHREGLEFSADSGSFQIKDPYQLNDFKKEMEELHFMQVIPEAEYRYDGNALTIRDETFIRAAEQLLRNEKLYTEILPFMGVVILCTGYVTASLFLRSRRTEYAIMRSLGQSFGECFFILCREYALTALAGSLSGGLFGMIFMGTDFSTAFGTAGAFLCCYVLGEAAALLPLKKLSVMAVLCKND